MLDSSAHAQTASEAAASAPLPGAPGEPAVDARLHWQSMLVLLLVLPAASVWAALLALRLGLADGNEPGALARLLPMLLPGPLLALLVWRRHAATPAGALTGGLLMTCFCLTTPGWHSSAWPLATMLVLTLAATHVGRGRKQRLGTAESRHARGAAQVAANLGAAALAGTLINAHGQFIALTVLLAALAEAAADTLASELGQALPATPRLITTFRQVPPGTDGGITVAGTALGVLGAAVVTAVGALTIGLPWSAAVIAGAAGVAGLLADSILGATVERAGWLNNDAVNFLSTLVAAGLALVVAQTMH